MVYGHNEYERWFREMSGDGQEARHELVVRAFRKLGDLALDVIGESVRHLPIRAFMEHTRRRLSTPFTTPSGLGGR
jgi:hypothetical protein